MSSTGRKVVMGSAWRTANSVAVGLAFMAIMPFVVRSLGDRMYGIWTLVATFMGYSSVLELGLSQAVTRYFGHGLGSQDHEECNRIYNTSLRIYLVLAGVMVLITVAAAALAPMFCRNPEDGSLFWKLILLVGLNFAMLFPSKVFKGALEAQLRFDLTAGLDLAALALRTSAIIGALLLGYKVLALAWAAFLTGIPSLLASIYFTHRELPFLRFDSRYWKLHTAKTLFSYSLFSFIIHIADVLRTRLDNIVVGALVALAAVTHYSVAGRLAQYFDDIISAVLGVCFSVFSRQDGAQDYAGLRRTFFLASRLSLSIASFIAFGLIAWGKYFIARWMGPHYVDAYPVLVVLTVSSYCVLFQRPSTALMYGISKHKFLAQIAATEGVLNLILSLLLVRKYGILGVALGTLIPRAFFNILVQPVYVCRISGIGYWNYVRTMGKTFGVILLSLLLPYFITLRYACPSYAMLTCIALFSAALYVVPVWSFGFSASETQTIQAAVLPAWARSKARSAGVLAE